jgi:tetratricopeptide (TPR) repeat protein
MSIHGKLMVGLCVMVALTLSAAGEEKPWREIRSPHFRVITNGSEGAGRRVAREFEQMRGMFADQFPGFNVDPPAPLLILAPEDEATTRKLFPEFWLHPGPKPAGVYMHGPERQFAVVRLDVVDDDRYNPDRFKVVYHEYVHSLLHLNFRWLPTWLDEGLAEFYGNTRFERNQTYIGAPSRNRHSMEVFNQRSSIPLDKFLDQRGSFSRSEQDTYLFYIQSWALTHFLTFGPGMERGTRLKKFFNALQAGTEQKKAFQDTFGNLEQVRKNLDDYVQLFAFTAGIVPTPPHADERSFASRTMTLAETLADLSTFYLGSQHFKEARDSAEVAIKSDPKVALAYEVLGFLDLREGKDDAAGREFSQAVDLDSHMYLSLFAKTMMSPLPHATSPGDRELFRAALTKVLDGNPQFAPAYVEWAKSFVAEGNLSRALALARTAEKIQPGLAGYHLLTGEILLRAGHPVEAAAHAVYVANRWSGVDHDQAMELWNRVPPARRPAEAPVDVVAPNLQSVEGTVKSVACEPNLWTLTLDRGGQPLIFKIKTPVGGFSDTLWFGGHFNRCYHVAGLRAVVRYKPAADKSAPDEVVSWGFRDDLPAPPANAEAAKPN